MNEEIFERLKKISERLKKEYHAEKVILYGSYARSEASEDSDIDFLVIASTNERMFERMATARKLIRELRYRMLISLIVFTPEEITYKLKRGDVFIQTILNEGMVL